MIRKQVGVRIKELRNERKISQEECAFVSGLNRAYFGSVERGERNISILNLNKICLGLNITLQEFLMEIFLMKKKINIDDFKEGIFALMTRRFGNLAEIMIQKIYNLDDSKKLEYDKIDKNGQRIEIKFSRVMKANENKISSKNVVKECLNTNFSNRKINYADILTQKFDCNIQQVKRKEFDVLYYGLFFADKIFIFKINSNEIEGLKGYSDKQHRNNLGEGQFHINNDTIDFHIEKYLDKEIDYKELYEILK